MFECDFLAVRDGERSGDRHRVRGRPALVKASRADPPLPRALTTDDLRRVLAAPDRFATRGTRDLELVARSVDVIARANSAISEISDARTFDSGPTNHDYTQSS